MARDLAPLVEGSHITAAWWDWPAVVRYPEPGEFRRAVVGKQVLRVGRRAKWLVLDLSDGAALAIQVKMTGQLFVLPEGTAHDQHVHLRLTLDAGPLAGGAAHDGPRSLAQRRACGRTRERARCDQSRSDSSGVRSTTHRERTNRLRARDGDGGYEVT